jgi:hypothetical protein
MVSFNNMNKLKSKEFLMRVTVKKSATSRSHSRNGRSAWSVTSDESVDFSIFGAKEIRDVLKNKAHCLRAGFPPNHVIIETLNEIRDHYILRVGLPTYLSQMLGDLATVPMQYCNLYSEDGRRIEINLNGGHKQPMQRFIAKWFGKDDLPFKVEVRRGSKPGRTEVRYL